MVTYAQPVSLVRILLFSYAPSVFYAPLFFLRRLMLFFFYAFKICDLYKKAYSMRSIAKHTALFPSQQIED